jgi:hypothetical protein
MFIRGVINIGLVLAFVGIAGYGFLDAVYMPLEQGSTSGSDDDFSDSRFLRTETDPFGSGTLYVYCAKPKGDFAWLISLRNTSPLPVTLLGLGEGPLVLADQGFVDGFGIRDLAPLRAAEPADTPLTSHDYLDPRKAPTLAPVTLASGDEFEVWVRYATGDQMAGEGTITTRSIPVRYRILVVERSAEVLLRDGVGITQPCKKG